MLPEVEAFEFALFCEISDRLARAEELTEALPSQYSGIGAKGRKVRVDGYQDDDSDNSLSLIICDFAGDLQPESMTRTRAESCFKQLQGFVEECLSERIWSDAGISQSGAPELASSIISGHQTTTRYRLYLFTDSVLSDRLRDLPEGEIGGVPVEYQIWDCSRLAAVSASTLGLEETEIDLTEYVEGGLPCLSAGGTEDYQGYLVVMPGDALAKLYDRYGSRLLEGNVRAYLTARGKINKGIQGTIRAAPEKFFVYNNGITCTATDAGFSSGPDGRRLTSVKYLQIVNGGQTTASLHAAMKIDRAKLDDVTVQMKLSVVTTPKVENLEDLIEDIARYSNSQNKVSEADFFSNHTYHRALERKSRSISAPSESGAQYNTGWFYERARGQYQNEQLHMKPADRNKFQRRFPRARLMVKTDVAKYENSWLQKPHTVSLGAQKNFADFAKHVTSEWGGDGARFDNDGYFRDVVARAIIFRTTEKLVSGSSWYQTGLPRAQIVTYTVAKLSQMVSDAEGGSSLDFRAIWNKQGLDPVMEKCIESLSEAICDVITHPPDQRMLAGEWSKKPACWDKVKSLEFELPIAVQRTLIGSEEAGRNKKEQQDDGKEDLKINALIYVIDRGASYWKQLMIWASEKSPIYGKEADLVRNASRIPHWHPTDRQAALLLEISRRMEHEGFRATK